MKIVFVTFSPWIIFWLLLAIHQTANAALAACAASAAVILLTLIRGRQVKTLQVVTLFIFVVLSLVVLLIDHDKFWIWARIFSSLSLALTLLISILFRRPLTLEYVREQYPREVVDSARFIRVNSLVCWVWCAVFFSQLIIPVSRLFGFNPSKALGPAFSILGVIAAAKFSSWYFLRQGFPRKK